MATTRDELNQANPNRLAVIFRELKFGDVLNALIAGSATETNTIGGAVSATVGANIAAFTDPPAAAEMATLRTFVNALKADAAATIALVNQLRTAALSISRTTETGVTVTSNVATLANVPVALLVASATAGTTLGMKKLNVGPITGANAVVPKPGEATWDGGTKVLFAVADAVTTADFFYTKAADTTVSALQATVDALP